MSAFLGDGRPLTASSIDTDRHGNERTSVVSSSGPVGEPGLPPSRQSGAAGTGARTSRRGFAAFGGGGGWGGGGGGARSRSSRPESSSTHVPLANTTFFRPMSSQKLQAQRGQNVVVHPSATVTATAQGASPIVEEREKGVKKTRMRSRSQRNSNASVHTMRDAGRRDEDAPPLPVSRGGYSIATSAEEAPVGGSVDSTAPLDLRTPQQKELDEKVEQKKRLGLGLGSRQSSGLDLGGHGIGGGGEGGGGGGDQIANSTSTANKKPPLTSSASSARGRGRNYEYFAGNMLFFCLGRCLNTRAKPLNILTLLLTLIPLGIFLGFSAPYIWLNISPAPVIILTYISLLTLSSFFHAAFSDPGILPRNLHPHPELEIDSDPLAIGPPSTEWVMVKTFPTTKPPRPADSTAEMGLQQQQTTAMEVPTKYCKTCSIWRPPRTHHCRICDACMETQDHHCVWLNNCVGRRNYRYFFAFVAWGSVMALLLVAFSALHIAHFANSNHTSFGSALRGRSQEQAAFAMMIFAILALPYPGSLWVYHLFLVGRGETTREYLNGHKFLEVDRHRPFSLGSKMKNWAAVLARPRGPSYLNFKRPYREGDVRLGYGTRRKERVAEEKREAREQKKRVAGLKSRFSVGAGGGDGEKVEMKRLNSNNAGGAGGNHVQGPPSTANGGGNGRPRIGARLNSTPRIGGGEKNH